MADKITTVDAYIASFDDERSEMLERVRSTIREVLPNAEEKVRYGMPAVMLGGRYAIHFAAWKKHLGLYPVPVLDSEFEREIAPFRAAKDSVNFSYSQPIPYPLIKRVTAAIVAQRAQSLDARQ
jgi:uncharacterized protein YdhG (YjbR/CyaY superfamily)